MDKTPIRESECDGCGADGEWVPIVWDIDEDGEETIDVTRKGYVSVCPECGVFIELSLASVISD